MRRPTQTDLKYAAILARHGMNYPLATVLRARDAGIPISLAAALNEQETGNARNVFGHDPTTSIPRSWMGGKVTLRRYRSYKARRAQHGMQGVGPLQLTWWQTQDLADRLGGCHKPGINMRVGYATLAANIRALGYAKGIERYNGSGPRAVAYSKSVRAKARKWHNRLTA